MSLLCSSTPSWQLHLSTLFFLTPSWQLHLSMLFFSTPSSIDDLTPFDTSICQELLRIYIKDKHDSILTLLNLSLDSCVFSPPKLLSLTPNPLPKWFSSFFKFSLHLVCFFSLIYMHFHVLKPRFWGFWKILGFLKLMSFCWNLGWVFPYMSLKSHTLHSMSIIIVFSCI